VIEVPTEMAAADAFSAAKPGDTIQIKGLKLGSGWDVPPFVTLRGCDGAALLGWVDFLGSAGTVEGFEVSAAGQIVADVSGTYAIRHNRFTSTTSNVAGVGAWAIQPYVKAAVVVVVERNWFEGRPVGIEALTKYDVVENSVDLKVHDNVFTGVESAVVLNEAGLMGEITATIEHNTFYDFETAVKLYSVASTTLLSANLFVLGDLGVGGNSVYELRYNLGWQMTAAHSVPPVSGSLATANPLFANAAGGNFSLGPGSPALDVLPGSSIVPGTDYAGCPRPVAIVGTDAKADVGALEAQGP
jgi:hypothetical protein